MAGPLTVTVLRRAGGPGPASAFELAGDAVSIAESVGAALETVKAGGADIVFVDLEDERATLDVCGRLRAECPEWLPVAVCLSECGPGSEAARRLEEAGAGFVFADAHEMDGAVPLLRRLAAACARARQLEDEIPERMAELESSRRFTHELVAQLPLRLYVLDEEMRVLFANRTALADTGTEPLAAVGQLFTEIMPAVREGGPVWSAVKGALQTRKTARLLGLRMGGFSGRREMVVNISVHPANVSGLLCARVMIDDVTDEWLAEQGRLREARKVEDIVSAMGAGIATIDADMTFTWTNRTFSRWFGPGVGKRCSDVFLGGRCGEADCPAERTLEHGTPESENWQRHTPDGLRRTFQNSFARVAEPDGRQSLIVLVEDVTAQADRIEQAQLIEQLGRAIQGVRDLDELLQVILTCVTAGHALGFNRAFLFLRNRRTKTLDGRTAVGPGSHEEAHRVWAELAARQRSLEDALREARRTPPGQSPLFRLIRDISYPLGDVSELPVRVFRDRRSALVKNAASDWRLTREFRSRFGSAELVAVPLVSKGESLGVIVADNLYNERPIDQKALALLETFATPAGLAIENAEAFADLRDSLAALRRTRQQLVDQTKLAAVGRVATHIAHEIRNPLATIGGFAHAIKSRPREAGRARENAGIIYEEVLRLERMLSGIMDFSRPSRPVLVRQSLNHVVERAVEMLAGQFDPKVAIRAELDPRTPALPIDAGQTRQLLINLVRNAAEAMGGDGGQVSILTRPEERGAALVIEDDGPGIPEDHQARVFEPFFTTKKGGTGLGLAVCRQIVAEHGGTMRLESPEGAGTRFTLMFPREAPPPLEDTGLP